MARRDPSKTALADTNPNAPRVVIVGAGLGGLTLARALQAAPVTTVIVDRVNHHLFQPLLYQVATASLSPANIATPIREVLAAAPNTRVLLASASAVSTASKRVVLTDGELPYDYLVLAAGAEPTYFGRDEWAPHAPALKTIPEALEIRRRVLFAYERAERASDPARRAALLTFVVIGGGPTGVEMAGSLAELGRFALKEDFRSIRPHEARVILIEAGPRILPAFSEKASRTAAKQLTALGVEVLVGRAVTSIDRRGVDLGDERIRASTVVWGAGVKASPLARSVGAPLDPQGRVVVQSDLSIPGHPEVFVIGDMARFEQEGRPLPGVGPVAMQQARYVAAAIDASIHGEPRPTFRYRHKGMMATVGRSRAVAAFWGVDVSGFVAWLAWLSVHVAYVVGFRNRVHILLEWAWAFFTHGRGARLIPGHHEELERASPASTPSIEA